MQYPLPECQCDEVGRRYDVGSGLYYCSRLRAGIYFACERKGIDPLYFGKAGDILCSDVNGNCQRRYRMTDNECREDDGNLVTPVAGNTQFNCEQTPGNKWTDAGTSLIS